MKTVIIINKYFIILLYKNFSSVLIFRANLKGVRGKKG